MHREMVEAAALTNRHWVTGWQRPMHFMRKLRSQPWWDKTEFAWCALLERHFGAIREEVLTLQAAHARDTAFTPVGGRAAHDSSLVAAGEWREFPLYGNGRKYEENCARCPVADEAGGTEDVPGLDGLISWHN